MTTNLTYIDERFGDRYEITLDSDLEFLSATRHTGRIGSDTIHYDSIADLNPFHRNEIEQKIWKLQHKKR